MQVFIPYLNPFYVARVLDKRRLNKQIIECQQILRAAADRTAPWSHHPVVAMWRPFVFWLSYYRECLVAYRDGNEEVSRALGHWLEKKWNRPYWLTKSLCVQHRRRLYTKNPVHYAMWARYGTSDENWYYTEDGMFLRYVNGKKK